MVASTNKKPSISNEPTVGELRLEAAEALKKADGGRFLFFRFDRGYTTADRLIKSIRQEADLPKEDEKVIREIFKQHGDKRGRMPTKYFGSKLDQALIDTAKTDKDPVHVSQTEADDLIAKLADEFIQKAVAEKSKQSNSEIRQPKQHIKVVPNDGTLDLTDPFALNSPLPSHKPKKAEGTDRSDT